MRAYIWVAAAALIISAAAATQAAAQATVTMGIDTDPAGNRANSLGTVEACRSVKQGDSFQVDVFVKGVPPASGFLNGLSGFAFNFKYDPKILEVTAIDANMMLAAAGPRNPFEVTSPLPNTDGNFRVDEADLSQHFESGDGVLLRMTLQAVGPGLSPVSLGDDAQGDDIPDVLGAAGNPQYTIAAVENAAIGVDQPCTAPSPVVLVTPTPGPGSPGASAGPSGGAATGTGGAATGTARPGGTLPSGAQPTGQPGAFETIQSQGSSGLSTGAVIAISVGVAAAVIALGAGAWIAWRRSRSS